MIIRTMKIFFVRCFCLFLPPLLNIFCFCYIPTISVLYWAHLCMKPSLGISNFLEEISSLSHAIVFLYFFALIAEEGFLISPCNWWKWGKTTRPFRYDLNQIPYNYSVEMRNRFKGLDLIDRVPDELWVEVPDIVRETGIKTIPKKKKCKKAKWLSEEA